MTVLLTGGRQCGAVRYALSALPEDAHFCHCRMCQKAVGGPFAALAGVPPVRQYGIESRLPWDDPALLARLPGEATEVSIEGKPVAVVSYQHPDHDTPTDWKPGRDREGAKDRVC
jgi:hypothetical protein